MKEESANIPKSKKTNCIFIEQGFEEEAIKTGNLNLLLIRLVNGGKEPTILSSRNYIVPGRILWACREELLPPVRYIQQETCLPFTNQPSSTLQENLETKLMYL